MTNAPLPAGVLHVTLAAPTAGTALGVPGRAGAPIVTGSERADAGLQPFRFFAATVNVYSRLFERPGYLYVVAVLVKIRVGNGVSRLL